MVSCDTARNMGCQGGYLDAAWEFLQTNGICTDACDTYISGTTGEDMKCLTECLDGSKMEKYYCDKLVNCKDADCIKK